MVVEKLESLVVFYKEWGILLLVLMSLALQVILLICGELRRRKDSGVLKVVGWLAYLLADSTAIYALGHMSVTSPTSEDHQLMAFWAPFLLLHLGGQDSITAYSIEDNRLWLRHLQNLVVQVLAATYVLYQSSIIARPTLLRPAAILMFVVGVVKYGQRVCALKLACGGSNLSGKNYREFEKLPLHDVNYDEFVPHQAPVFPRHQIYVAHYFLIFPKYLLMGPLPDVDIYTVCYNWEFMYGVAEMQLSLMHDVFYSKAELIHSWHGYCIRVFSLPATVASLWLFRRFSEKDAYRRADVAATYVLLAGAVVLEITSLLKVMFSTWTYGNLIRSEHGDFNYALERLATIALWFRYHAVGMYEMCRGRGGIPPSTRCWSGSMGQHNIIYMCSHCNYSLGSRIARRVGREDWWNMLVYTSSVPVSPDISQWLKRRMGLSVFVDSPSKKLDNIQGLLENEHFTKDNEDHILNSRGRAALKKRPGLYKELRWCVDTAVDETILVWHIATHVYLSWYEAENTGRPHPLAQVTKELSNYMMFLLAARPYMLPGIVSRQRYVQLCFQMLKLNSTSEADMLRIIRSRGDAINCGHHVDDMHGTFKRACELSAKLISKQLETHGDTMLLLIDDVWMELLCYVAYHCNPDSHARQLSNGGEFTTIVAFLLEYTDRGAAHAKPSQGASDGYKSPLEMFNESEAEAIEDV